MPHNAYTTYQFDHIEEPDELDFSQNFFKFDLLRVTALGRFKEGPRFYCYHEGFPNYSIRFTLGGRGTLLYRDRILGLERGDVILTNHYGPQRISSEDGEWSFLSINLVGSQMPYYEKFWNRGGAEIIHTEHLDELEAMWEQLKIVAALTEPTSDFEINLILTRMLTMILTEREKNTPRKKQFVTPEWVGQAATSIAAHCCDRISIDSIATKYFVNRAYFSRQFKRYMGVSPKEYQLFCRLENAIMLLQATDDSVAEIAERTGFANQSLFTKAFRERYGQTPSAYRQSCAKKR